MIITYNIGILAARLKLTALSGLDGVVISSGLHWHIQRVDAKETQLETELSSKDAQSVFTVAEGDYVLQVNHLDKVHDLGGVFLQKNTETDMVFILPALAAGAEDEFFAEFDVEKDFFRRQTERDQQSDRYGAATLPLRDPNPEMQGELSSSIKAHPLLSDSAQFDGVPPDFRPDPSENESAARLTYEKQLQNQLGASPSSAPAPTAR